MVTKIFLTQRTQRHVIKRLNSAYAYESNFGTWQTVKIDNTGFNFPMLSVSDGTYIYVCDSLNSRIVKLDNTPAYVSSVSVSTEIGVPQAITYDGANLYVAGLKNYVQLSVAKITTALSISKYNNNITLPVGAYPLNITGICADFTSPYFLITGLGTLLKVHESVGSFDSPAVAQTITYETTAKFYGNVMNGGSLYLLGEKLGSFKILRVNSSYKNTGDSDEVSKSARHLFTSNLTSDMFVYDCNGNVFRYDSDLNQVETVFSTTGGTISTDCSDVTGVQEINV